ncbi:MAG TPA: ATP-binding protein, partial [Actinomycetota bacterium]|nr:ATP-binding protein [Actinomycetota bacterium]
AIPVVSLGLLLVAAALSDRAGLPFADPLVWVPLSLSCAVVGAVLWERRVGGTIAGLLILNGIAIPLVSVVQAYADAAIARDLPAAAWAAWLFQVSLGFSISFFLILQLFPTGHPLSPRWRVLVVLTLANAAITALAPALGVTPEFTANFPGVVHPLQVLSSGVVQVIDNVAGLGNVAVFVASAIALVLRYRRSAGDERLQLTWVTAAGALAAGGFALGIILMPSGPAAIFALLAPLIPISMGIAILKYRLYDIDIVINKTVVYAALGVFITVVYIAIVVGLGRVLDSEHSVALSVAATAVVAVAFQPVRVRVQHLANRLVYGRRADPYEVMAGFAERVAGTLSVDRVLPEMAEAAALGVGASQARIRVFLPGGDRDVVWPPGTNGRVAPPQTIAVAYQGTPVGEIAVIKPPGEQLTPGEQHLLDDLARQAGLALHNVRLTDELAIRLEELAEQSAQLQISRQRLVTARDAQRRGLERDIREGPERRLIDIGRRVREATELLDRDAAAAEALLDRLGVEANTTLEGLRDLARGIFPPLLADQGIEPALEAHIRKVGANATIEASTAFRDRRFDADTEACVYFCCLQAIQNVIRHAGNAPCTVGLDLDDHGLVVAVRDEGPGFDADATPPGMGRQIMRDRVDALDGRLEIVATPGTGTTVTIRLPLVAAEVGP